MTPETTEISTNAAVVGVLNVLGGVLKNMLPVDNRWIPLILLVVGVLVNCGWLNIWTFKEMVEGFLLGAGAIGLHQAFINTKPAAQPVA